MKAFLLAPALLVLVLASDASASDELASPSQDWSGPYIGLTAGWSHSRTKVIDLTGEEFGDDTPGASLAFTTDGLGVGGTIGYNFQRGSFVFGPEIDFGIATNKDTHLVEDEGDGAYTNYNFSGSFALRAGYAFSRTLIFAKAGLALAKIRSAGGEFDGIGDEDSDGKWGFDGDESGFGDKTRAGWLIGAGVEHLLLNGWSLKLEYTYADFGEKTYTDLEGDGADYKFEDHFHNVRLGMNYHF